MKPTPSLTSPPKWTREPWILDGYDVKQPNGGRMVAYFGPHHTPQSEYPKSCRIVDEANGSRAVQCVNALAGIESPDDFVREVRVVLKEVVEAVNPVMRGQAADKAARLLSQLEEQTK